MLLGLLTGLAFMVGTAPIGETAIDLVDLADRYCIAAYGNHARTRQSVEADGFVPIPPETVENLRLPGPRYLRGYSKTIDGVEVRVLTAVVRFRGFGQGENVFRSCWVSASAADRGRVDRDLTRMLGVRRFRERGANVYAWWIDEDGRINGLSRRESHRSGLRDALERGTQYIMTNEYDGLVAITYMTPTATPDDPGD